MKGDFLHLMKGVLIFCQPILEFFLDQFTLISLEDQARWAIRNRLTDAEKVPNYLDYIYPGVLKAVKPEAVKIAGR
jgi:hypothetical protein